MLIYFEKHTDIISTNFEFKNVRTDNEQDLKVQLLSAGYIAKSVHFEESRIDKYWLDIDEYHIHNKRFNRNHYTIDMFLKTYLRREKLKKINEQIRKEII